MTKLKNTTKTPMTADPLLAPVDYSVKENQIGCGYCINEEDCTEREPTVNKAKKGCKRFRHFSEHFQ